MTWFEHFRGADFDVKFRHRSNAPMRVRTELNSAEVDATSVSLKNDEMGLVLSPPLRSDVAYSGFMFGAYMVQKGRWNSAKPATADYDNAIRNYSTFVADVRITFGGTHRMEPISIVTAFVAALYIVGRGPLVIAPATTVSVYRRLFATPGRTRIFGVLIALLAAALILSARQARIAQGGITILIEGFGWYAAAVGIWVTAAPRPWRRVLYSFWDGISDQPTLLRALGAFNICIGIVFGLLAYAVR
jgi:hypothetical protein